MYSGWIKIRNLPIDKWSIETFQRIGDACGGYIEIVKKTLMEANIRVKENILGFLPTMVCLSSSSSFPVTVTLDVNY